MAYQFMGGKSESTGPQFGGPAAQQATAPAPQPAEPEQPVRRSSRRVAADSPEAEGEAEAVEADNEEPTEKSARTPRSTRKRVGRGEDEEAAEEEVVEEKKASSMGAAVL
jgi:hypothetical protein